MTGVKGNRIIQVFSKHCVKFAGPYRVSNKYTVKHINIFCLLFQSPEIYKKKKIFACGLFKNDQVSLVGHNLFYCSILKFSCSRNKGSCKK